MPGAAVQQRPRATGSMQHIVAVVALEDIAPGPPSELVDEEQVIAITPPWPTLVP